MRGIIIGILENIIEAASRPDDRSSTKIDPSQPPPQNQASNIASAFQFEITGDRAVVHFRSSLSRTHLHDKSKWYTYKIL